MARGVSLVFAKDDIQRPSIFAIDLISSLVQMDSQALRSEPWHCILGRVSGKVHYGDPVREQSLDRHLLLHQERWEGDEATVTSW